MPIQFPLPKRGNPFDRWSWQWGARQCPQAVRAPNLGSPGRPFSRLSLSPGLPRPVTIATNLRNLGSMYRHGDRSASVLNPQNVPVNDKRVFYRVVSDARGLLSYVSRDAAGAPLGGCRVLVFKTSDNSFLGETLSDGSGNWLMTVGMIGALFFVEYKAGTPDVAGTSLNTISPAPF